MEGQLEQRNGRWQLTFVRKLPHSPEKVWKALTEPEHLKGWFPGGPDHRWPYGHLRPALGPRTRLGRRPASVRAAGRRCRHHADLCRYVRSAGQGRRRRGRMAYLSGPAGLRARGWNSTVDGSRTMETGPSILRGPLRTGGVNDRTGLADGCGGSPACRPTREQAAAQERAFQRTVTVHPAAAESGHLARRIQAGQWTAICPQDATG
ncbi:MAG: hypothetical protein E6I99_10200 [Chloroflexi bacterium]|nr:MAG: hypothetical protein E6I99_10200 [Chloroflexota bacterium]TMD82218.1 MAG: hypothetical protein E6I74_09630 [Chloroflexota bacterium]